MPGSKFLKVLFLIMTVSIFYGCTLSTDEKAEAAKILEIREDLLNKGDINALELLFTDDFPDRKNYLDQLQYQRQYFQNFLFDMNSISIVSASNISKKMKVVSDYDISYKSPEDIAEIFWLGRKEEIVLVKENIGWKIADIKEIKNTGRKIDPQTVHGIFFALDTRKTALNNGDHELFETVIGENYPDREELIDDFKKNANAFININYGLKSRKFQYVSEKMDEARVIQFFDLVFNIKGLDSVEKVEDQKELISLKKMPDNTWKITDGLK